MRAGQGSKWWWLACAALIAVVFSGVTPTVAESPVIDLCTQWDQPWCYRNNTQLVQYMQALVARCPDLMTMYSIGQSVQGRELYVIRATSPVLPGPKPRFKYQANMHGDEVTGREMVLQLLTYFCNEYGVNQNVTDLLDYTEISVLPTMNPDGFAVGYRRNANGVDLNRDFPDRFLDPVNTYAGRQPETVAVMQWINRERFHLSANLHNGALVANYPWDSNANDAFVDTPSPDDAVFRQLAHTYADLHPTMHLSSNFSGGITNGAAWYPIHGSIQDWIYVWGNGFDITLELDDDYWPPAAQLPLQWEQNRLPMMGYIYQLHCGVRGTVTDTNGRPLNATIRVIEIEHDIAADNGFFARPLSPGEYLVQAFAPGHYEQTLLVHVNQSSFCDPRRTPVLAFTLEPVTLSPHVLLALVLGPALVLTGLVLLVCVLRQRWRVAHGQHAYPEIDALIASDSKPAPETRTARSGSRAAVDSYQSSV